MSAASHTLTALERAILHAIATSEYGEGIESTIWTFSVWDNIDHKACPKRASLSGGISSLSQKGLVGVSGSGNEATIWATPAGIAAYQGAQP